MGKRNLPKEKELDDKRDLIHLIFDLLQIEASSCNIVTIYSKLSRFYLSLSITNSSKVELPEVQSAETFELDEKIDNTFQMNQFWCAYPEMRRGRDSNSRDTCVPGGFQDRCTSPLCDLSITVAKYIILKAPLTS
jgi:hypothetical protein